MKLSASISLALLGISLQSACNSPVDPNVITSETRPDKRSEVIAIANAEHSAIVIFGGNDGPIVNQIPTAAFLDDTWIFKPGTGWTEVVGDTHPYARGRYAASYDSVNDRMLLFGGRWREANTSGDYTLFKDLWSFDFATQTWTLLDDGGTGGPHERYYAASAFDAESGLFYLFGGAINSSGMSIIPTEDVWTWDGSSWTEVQTTGDAPSKRIFFGNAYDSTRNRLLIFGGQIGDFVSMAYNDLYALDLNALSWTQLDTGTGPSTRMHGAIDYDLNRDRYVLFGGHTDIGDANDLWSFEPGGGTWSTIYQADTFNQVELGCGGNPREVPTDYVTQDLSAPERRHRGMHILLDDDYWIFGGMHAECSAYLDDTWRFDLKTDTWVELISARSGESCARRNEDCECLCL